MARAHNLARMIGNLIGPEIKELIAARNFAGLRTVVEDFSPADVAEIICDLSEEDQAVVFRILPHDQATEVLEYLEPETQQAVLKAMGNAEAARILNDMSADDRTAFLEELPGAAVARLLQLLSPEEKAIAQSLLNYPEDSVGRLMTPDLLARARRVDRAAGPRLHPPERRGFRDAARALRDGRTRPPDR
jgi:magnesium transporter